MAQPRSRSSIRPLERDDLEQVADLFLRVMRPGSSDRVPEVAAYFERTALDHPYADPEMPSLVYADERAAIKGFIGSYVCRMRFDGDRIRAACPGNLVSAHEARSQAVGALLLRQYINGPQDLTFTDTAGGQTRQMYKGLGAQVVHLGSFSWARILRPCRLARDRLVERGRRRASKLLPPALCAGLDATAMRLAPGLFGAELPPVGAETLRPQAMLRELPGLSGTLRLYPDYERNYLEWLYDELARPRRRGSLVRRLVHDGGRVLGWYVYYLKPGGISRVLQVVGTGKDVGSVLDHLFHDAQQGGAAMLDGRLEPRLVEALSRRRCIMRYTGAAVAHSRNREILDALFSDQALLSRMDSDYWAIPPRRDVRLGGPRQLRPKGSPNLLGA
jgi:hypothetical protein